MNKEKRKIYSNAAKKKWSDPKHREKMLRILSSPEVVEKRTKNLKNVLTKIDRKGKNNGHYKHGLKKHSLYSVWQNMKQRCYNPNTPCYDYYGGRGISVYEEWRNNFKAFFDWSIENGYERGLELDRKNNDGNYEPGNCRWITHTENCKNKK